MLLPLADAGREDGMRIVPAQEILDKIERGEPVEYDHVIVEGDLDLGKLDLPKMRVVRTPDELSWGVSENASMVLSPIRINGSLIYSTVYFIGAILNATDFSDSTFNGQAYFPCSTFNGTADFKNSIFNGQAYFPCSTFNRTADFKNSTFNRTADFGGSSFNRTAYFWYSTFNGQTDFSHSTFNSLANFRSSIFNRSAYFLDSIFNGSSQFSESAFNDKADFSRSKFKESIFMSSQFNKPVSFDLADFNGTLYLDRAKYDKLYISWKNIKKLGYDDGAYLALLENFKKLGYIEDYDDCYFEYRKVHRYQNWGGGYHPMPPAEEWARKKIDALLEVFYGYGKKPLRPFLWSTGTILFFGIVWLASGINSRRGKNGRGTFERFGLQNESAGSESQDRLGRLRAFADAFLFSAIVFLSGARLFVEPPAQPEVQLLSSSQVKWTMILERVLGAFFSILFFLAIGGTVVR